MKANEYSFRVFYTGVDITTDLNKDIIGISYTDNLEGKADEITITIHDNDGRWQDEWDPSDGDKLLVYIGDKINEVSCGEFFIDTYSLMSISPDIIELKGISIPPTKTLRTRKNRAYENISIREILNTIAENAGMDSVFIGDDFLIKRETQFKETDLSFLSKLGAKYGFAFSCRGLILYMISVYSLQEQDVVADLTKQDFDSLTVNSTISQKANELKAYRFNPYTGQVLESGDKSSNVDNKETYATWIRVDGDTQLNRVVKKMLNDNDTSKTTIDGTLNGTHLLMAGVNFKLKNAGRNSGIYHVTSSTHTITDEYLTKFSAKKIADLPESESVLLNL